MHDAWQRNWNTKPVAGSHVDKSKTTSPNMTRHNATWDESQYHNDSDISEEIEDDDPESPEHGKSGYYDYRDDE